MSDYQPIPAAEVNPEGTEAAPQRKKRPSWAIPAVAAVLAGVIGYGAAGGAPAAAEPEVITETKEVEVIKEVEVPVEVVKEVTPQVCLDALVAVSEVLDIASEFPMKVEPAARAGLSRDVAAIEQITAEMEDANGRLEALTPTATAAIVGCQAGAK